MDELKYMLDIAQLCEITGWKRGYVYTLISQRRITHYKPFGKTPILSVEDKAKEIIKKI